MASKRLRASFMFAKLHSMERLTKFVRKDERLPALQRLKSAVQDAMVSPQTIPIVINYLPEQPQLLRIPAGAVVLEQTNIVVHRAKRQLSMTLSEIAAAEHA
jgi:DeoR/GlpR family transcriptional regulator of sugar metabolism